MTNLAEVSFIEKICLEGALTIASNEGGYSSPSIGIHGQDIAFVIAELLNCEYDDYKKFAGKWRFTLERIE